MYRQPPPKSEAGIRDVAIPPPTGELPDNLVQHLTTDFGDHGQRAVEFNPRHRDASVGRACLQRCGRGRRHGRGWQALNGGSGLQRRGTVGLRVPPVIQTDFKDASIGQTSARRRSTTSAAGCGARRRSTNGKDPATRVTARLTWMTPFAKSISLRRSSVNSPYRSCSGRINGCQLSGLPPPIP